MKRAHCVSDYDGFSNVCQPRYCVFLILNETKVDKASVTSALCLNYHNASQWPVLTGEKTEQGEQLITTHVYDYCQAATSFRSHWQSTY